MNFNALTTYKSSIIIKHSLLARNYNYLKWLGLSYNTSKFKTPISLLLILVLLSLSLPNPSLHIVTTCSVNYLSNLNYLLTIPFLFENILIF